jgi:hypothetical protein
MTASPSPCGPAYTSDRKDDPVIRSALLADATWLIADDTKHICTQSEGATEYQLQGTDRRVSAVTFSRFLDHLSENRPGPGRPGSARGCVPAARHWLAYEPPVGLA